MLDKIAAAVIGATGMVGQRFVQLLNNHPWFKLELLAASDKSAGNKYKEMVSWALEEELPESIAEKTIQRIDAEIFKNESIKLIFSALPAEVARDIEMKLVNDGFTVFSNASAYRMEKKVPLLIADINPEHLKLIEQQRKAKQSNGYIVTNPNCTAVGLVTALKPLADNFGLQRVIVTTYQALSGAGYPGVPGMDIIGNVIPYIKGEEQKVEEECKKILGKFMGEIIEPLPVDVLASCARVPVRDGHLESIIVNLEGNPTLDEIKEAFKNYNGLGTKSLPTAPDKTIILREEENRPQPILDVNSGTPERARGMAITIGRIKKINNKYRFFLLVHNTIRGAAGCSIMNAELAKDKEYL